ncbi:MAG: extensin family protein [Myxococcales bacterium]|nr:extensin family protein [Myxococcales bacterium]
MMRRPLALLPLLSSWLVAACGAVDTPADANDAGIRDTASSIDDRPDPREDSGVELDVAVGPMEDASLDVAMADARVADARVTDARVGDSGVMDARVADSGVAVSVPLPRNVMPGASCHALLDRIGVRYTVSGALMGVADPVRVTPPINGVNLRYASYTAAVSAMVMDCRLAVALFHATRELRTRWDVTDVVHLGVYNYRPIAGSTMLSQHAYAMAIDIANLRTSNGTTHSVLNDFVANGRPTCPPRASNARDRLLKEFACWMHESRVFHIVLTPNYNAAHRDHFHVDLTVGGNFIAYDLPAMMDPEPGSPFAWMIDDH